MKKIISFIIVLSLLTMTSYASVMFYDVDTQTEGGRAIYAMSEKGIISGYGNGFFGPDDTLTRAQAVKIINRVFGYENKAEIKFSDVNADAWYYNDVAIAVEAGYIKGYGDGLFGPDETLTREQVCVMLDNIMMFTMLPIEVTLNDAVSPWAEDSVKKMMSNFLIKTDENGFFRATENITREEACLILSQFVLSELPEIEPFDIATVARAELEGRLERIIKGIREDLMFRTEDQGIRDFFEAIARNMEKYLADSTYDYKTEALNTQKQFRALLEKQRRTAKDLIINFFMEDKYMDDLDTLYEFFF